MELLLGLCFNSAMSRLSPVLAVCLFAGLGASVAVAQSTDAPPPTTTPAALAAHPEAQAAPDATTGAPQPARAISSQTAARLTAGIPAYVPAKPAPAKLDDDDADSTDGDKPKNDIIRLPNYVVRERPPPVFTQKEILTSKGLAELEFKKHPGLNLWGLMPFSSLNEKIAIQMYDEEARSDNIADLTDTAHAIGRGGDLPEDEYIKRQTQQTFMHDVWGAGDENDGK